MRTRGGEKWKEIATSDDGTVFKKKRGLFAHKVHTTSAKPDGEIVYSQYHDNKVLDNKVLYNKV